MTDFFYFWVNYPFKSHNCDFILQFLDLDFMVSIVILFLAIYTILPKLLGRPLLMNRFDYFSHFYEYKS